MKKFFVIVALLISILVTGCSSLSDPSCGVKDMKFDAISSNYTIEEMTSGSIFCDQKWIDKSDIGYVVLYFNDVTYGNNYSMVFQLFNNNTRARIIECTLNSKIMDNVETGYFYQLLNAEININEFVDNVKAYRALSNLLGW